MGNVNIEGSTQPWAFEGKEFLRNLVIGKTVKCELEFKREIPIKDDDGNLQKDKTITHQCASLFLDGKNVAVEVLSTVLLSVLSQDKMIHSHHT